MSGYFTMTVVELKAECARRDISRSGRKKDLQVRLVEDDKLRGKVTKSTIIVPFAQVYRGNEKAMNPAVLVGESITHWKLDIQALQLFLQTGHCITMKSHLLRHGILGVDDNLFSSLLSLNGEDLLIGPHEGAAPEIALPIAEAVVAQRVSVASKIMEYEHAVAAWEETHVVIGLRIGGMSRLGYVFEYDASDDASNGAFGAVVVERLTERRFEDDEMGL